MKFYVLDDTGKPSKRQKENGDSEMLYDQERVLAFDYRGICENYDINLHTMKERVSVQHPDGLQQNASIYDGTQQ